MHQQEGLRSNCRQGCLRTPSRDWLHGDGGHPIISSGCIAIEGGHMAHALLSGATACASSARRVKNSPHPLISRRSGDAASSFKTAGQKHGEAYEKSLANPNDLLPAGSSALPRVRQQGTERTLPHQSTKSTSAMRRPGLRPEVTPPPPKTAPSRQDRHYLPSTAKNHTTEQTTQPAQGNSSLISPFTGRTHWNLSSRCKHTGT